MAFAVDAVVADAGDASSMSAGSSTSRRSSRFESELSFLSFGCRLVRMRVFFRSRPGALLNSSTVANEDGVKILMTSSMAVMK